MGIGESNLGSWVRQARVDRGEREGLTTTERTDLAQLCRETPEAQRSLSTVLHHASQSSPPVGPYPRPEP